MPSRTEIMFSEQIQVFCELEYNIICRKQGLKKKKINKNGPSAVTGKTPEGKLGRRGSRKFFKCSFLFYYISNPIFLASLCLALLLFVASLHDLKAL